MTDQGYTCTMYIRFWTHSRHPHTSCSWVSYGVSFMSTLCIEYLWELTCELWSDFCIQEENDHVIRRMDCTPKISVAQYHYPFMIIYFLFCVATSFSFHIVLTHCPMGDAALILNEHSFKCRVMITLMSISCVTAFMWMVQNPTDDKSTLVQEMACCCQATSHYLIQGWSRSMSSYRWVSARKM